MCQNYCTGAQQHGIYLLSRTSAVRTLNTLLPSTVNEDCSDLLGSTYQQQLEYRLAPHELSAPTPPIAVLSSPFLFALTSFPAELSSPPLHEPTCNENAVEINR